MPVTSLSSDQGENLGSSFSVKITPLLGAESKVPAPDSYARHNVTTLCSALGQGPTDTYAPGAGRHTGHQPWRQRPSDRFRPSHGPA